MLGPVFRCKAIEPALQPDLREPTPAHDDTDAPAQSTEALERIAVDHEKIRNAAHTDGPELILLTEEGRWVRRGGLQHLEWCESTGAKQVELVEQ